MELSNDYLTLKLCRLKGVEEMDLTGGGLVFIILKRGPGDCQCRSTAHRLSSGDVLVANGASGAKIRVRDGGEMVFWLFIAEIEHLYPLFAGREICLLQSLAEVFKTGKVYSASSPLAKQCVKLAEEVPAQFNFDHRSHLLRLVGAILTAEFKAQQPKLAGFVPMRDHVVQVFERLQTNEILSLSVGELAKKFNCSRRHLNRLFHQHFGVSVAAMRMEMRLLKAVSLLVDPDAKVIGVAEKCGFNHLGLFNTCFKKRFGVSPGQWRNTMTRASNRPREAATASRSLRNQLSDSESVNAGAGRDDTGRSRLLDRVGLSGLLKDIVALKHGVQPQDFAPEQTGHLEFARQGMAQIDT
jgi:AraC-like DNA-binding protein